MKRKNYFQKVRTSQSLRKFKKKRLIKTCNLLFVSTTFAAIIMLAYKNPANAALNVKEEAALFFIENQIETAKLLKQPAYAFEPAVEALSTLISKAVVNSIRVVKIAGFQLANLEKTMLGKIAMLITHTYGCIYSSINKKVSKLLEGGLCLISGNYLSQIQMKHKIGEALRKNL